VPAKQAQFLKRSGAHVTCFPGPAVDDNPSAPAVHRRWPGRRYLGLPDVAFGSGDVYLWPGSCPPLLPGLFGFRDIFCDMKQPTDRIRELEDRCEALQRALIEIRAVTWEPRIRLPQLRTRIAQIFYRHLA